MTVWTVLQSESKAEKNPQYVNRVSVKIEDDDTLGVVILGQRRLDASVLDSCPDPACHDADFLARDNVLEVALGLM